MARILIVDDAASDRLIEKAILEKAGHEVITSQGGEEALRRQLEQGVELVITDLQMPDVHGFELIGIFREMTPSPPVIAVSGTGRVQLHLARRLGAVETLEKPIDAERLLNAVASALEGREQGESG